MKKYICLIFLFIISFNKLSAQTTTYTNGRLYSYYHQYVNGKSTAVKINKKPLGENVTLTYNKFFNSYDITYKDENGNINKMQFKNAYDWSPLWVTRKGLYYQPHNMAFAGFVDFSSDNKKFPNFIVEELVKN